MSIEEEEKSSEEIIIEIQHACSKLGWCIALIDSSSVHGLIIGNMDYVKSVIELTDEDYEIWDKPQMADSNLH